MKKVKIVIMSMAIFIVALSVLFLSDTLIAKEQNDDVQDYQLSYIDVDSQEFSSEIAEAFETELGENYMEKIAKNVESSSIATEIASEYMNSLTGGINYPSDFGGQYINEDDELVIQIVKNTNLKNSIKKTALNFSDEIIYEYVDNSYEELEEINNQIIEYFSQDGAVNNGLNANYIDVINNVVIVELINNSTEEQNWFKSTVVDSELIQFVQGDTKVSSTATYNAGGNINDNCSIGYRVKRNGVNGFITAGHCYSENYNIPGFGTVKKRVYDLSNGLDGEFVQLSSGNSVTNNIQWSVYPATKINTSTNLYNIMIVGGRIAKSGFRTLATSGTIKNANYSSMSSDGTYRAKFVLTTALCNNGDSGGVVYNPGTQVTGGTVTGIVHAKQCTTEACDQPGPMIFSRSDLLDSNLGLTRY